MKLMTTEEIHYIQTKINTLKVTKIEGCRTMSITHTMKLTIVDAKVCNAATHTTHYEMLHMWRLIQRLQ